MRGCYLPSHASAGRQVRRILGIIGQGKLLGLIIDKAPVEAIVRRPAPAPDVERGGAKRSAKKSDGDPFDAAHVR